MDKKTYKVRFLKNEISGGYVRYTVKITSNAGDELIIQDRYRSMRTYWTRMTSKYRKSVPSSFPPKKWFGNKKPEFIKRRTKELEEFFNALLADPELAGSSITQEYFKSNLIKSTEAPPPNSNGPAPALKAMPSPVQAPAPSPSMAHNKKWRQIVDTVTKMYVDINFGDEPPSPEEVKKKSLAYSAAIKDVLQKAHFISKVLVLPKGSEEAFNSMSLDLIENERPMAAWLDDKMSKLYNTINNHSYQLYSKGKILVPFDATV